MTRGGTVALLSNASSRRLPLVTFALSLALVWGAAAVPAAEARKPKRVEVPAAAAAVIEAASQYLGLPYRLGTEGPDRFDCSGLIFRAFADAGQLELIGGRRIRAAGYMRWFAERGQFTSDPLELRPGDLVMYDHGKHIGFYLGDDKALSAILSGVSVHKLHGLTQDVTGFLRVDWNGDGAEGGPPVEIEVPVNAPEVPAELIGPSGWAPAPSEDLLDQPLPEVVERADMRTAGSRTFEAPDGTFTTEIFSRPIHYQAPDSADWLPIDLRFVSGDGGTSPASPASPASVATSPVGISLSAIEGDDAFARLSAGEHSISLGASGRGRGAGSPAPLLGLDGHYADYLGAFGEGTGLRLFPRSDGLKLFLVLAERPVSNQFDLTLEAPGLTVTAAQDGSIELQAEDGTAVGRVRAPLTLTSRDSQGNGGGVSFDAARLELDTAAQPATLSLVLDKGYLRRAAYPVFVDLTIAGLGASAPSEGAAEAGTTFVLSSWPDSNFSGFQRPEWPAHPELWHGRLPGREFYSEAYLRFVDPHASLRGATVESASLRMFPYWQFDSAGDTWIGQPLEAWQPSTLTWATRPAAGEDLGPLETSAGAWADIDVSDYVAGLLGGEPDHGLRLHASEIGRHGWKRIVAAAADPAGLEPRLVVRWSDLRPVALSPVGGASGGSELTWAHAEVAPEQVRFRVEVSSLTGDRPTIRSGVVRGKAGRLTTWSVPDGDLVAGDAYSWRVKVRYGRGGPWSAWSTAATFTYGPRSDQAEALGEEQRAEDGEGERSE